MPEQPITVTAAARGFSDLINRVRYRSESAILIKGGVPVARVVPFASAAPPCTAAGLAGLLGGLELSVDDAEWFAAQASESRRWA